MDEKSTARVALLYTRLNAQASNFRDYRPPLPPPFAERVHSMRNARQQARTLAGYWLLEHGATMSGWGEVNLSRLGRSRHGRPQLAGGPAFSISHCADIVACALISGCEAGLDIERLRQVDVKKLQRFLEPQSQANHTTADQFFRTWTAREAVVKATGQVGLSRIAKVKPQGRQAMLEQQQFYLSYPRLGQDVMACIASQPHAAQIWTRFIPAPDPENKVPHKPGDQ